MSREGYFLTVCLNPTLQKTILLERLTENEVNRSSEHYLDAAGKGINVSRVLMELGQDVVHLTQAGGHNRELFLELSRDAGIDVRWVESGSEIRFCYTIISLEENTTTEIVEEAVPVENNTEDLVYREFVTLLDNAHTVIISGTKADGFPDPLYPRMVKDAKGSGKLVILDIRGRDLIDSLSFSPDVIKPNYREFVETFLRKEAEAASLSVSKDRINSKMMELYNRYGVSCVLTRGKEPCLYIDGGKLKQALPPQLIPVNATGSGDAFCAGFAQSYAEGRNMDRAVAAGIECATLALSTIRPGMRRGY